MYSTWSPVGVYIDLCGSGKVHPDGATTFSGFNSLQMEYIMVALG